MPAQRQVILPSGVVVVAAADPDAALSAAARLRGSGIPDAALIAAPVGTAAADVTGPATDAVRRHGHAVVLAPDAEPALLAALSTTARSLGRAATVVVAGDAEFTARWRGLAQDTAADRVLELDAGVDVLPYRGDIDLRSYRGRAAVVGDVHGCQETLTTRLLPVLGWHEEDPFSPLLVSVGDVHDKGVASVAAIRWWLSAMRRGAAVMTDSNHARALVRALVRPDLPVRGCVAETVAEIDAADDADQLRADLVAVFGSLPSHIVLPGLVAVHAALTEQRLWRDDLENRRFAIHTRFHLTPWHWTGSATLVHGHDTVETVTTRRAGVNMLRPGHVPGPVVNIDTGAYAGGGLSAYLSWTGSTVTVPTVPAEVTSELARELSPLCA